MASWRGHHDAKTAICRLNRRIENSEPPAQLGLDWQFRLQFRLQLELLGVVAILPLPSRHERPERSALVAIDPVDGVFPAVELEDGSEKLRAEALLLEPLRHGVDARHLILQIGVADDDPRVAERVVAALDLRPGVRSHALEQLLDVALCAHEIAGRERLEDDRPRAGRA